MVKFIKTFYSVVQEIFQRLNCLNFKIQGILESNRSAMCTSESESH